MRHESHYLLAVEDLTKTYGGAVALDGVSLGVATGECLAVLGPNGAGKSTLIKILAGVERPDSGVVSIAAEHFESGLSPAGVERAGIAFVHQNLGLVDELTVAENIALVAGYRKRNGLIAWRAVRAFARKILDRWEIDIDAERPIGTLGAADRALVAIARALARDARIVVLDEPTAALPHHDVENLLSTITRIKQRGIALIYVTHRLGEVMRVADRATVLRNGRVVHETQIEATTQDELVRCVIGSDVAAVSPGPASRGATVLRLSGVEAPGLNQLDFEMQQGEIVALTGLVGAGQSALGEVVVGATAASTGSMELHGAPYHPSSLRVAQASGVVYLPEDRLSRGGVPQFDCTSNFHLRRRGLGLWTWNRAERRATARVMRDWRVVPLSPGAPLQTLSGGNQQKLLLAKWLSSDPLLLVAETPTAGVDVGARAEIYERLIASSRAGTGILLITPDAEEAAAVANRVVIFDRGAVVAELVDDEITEEAITAASTEDRAIVGER